MVCFILSSSFYNLRSSATNSHLFCITSSYSWIHLIDAIWCDNIAIELIPYTYYCAWLEFLYYKTLYSCFFSDSDDRMIDVWSASSSSSSRNQIASALYMGNLYTGWTKKLRKRRRKNHIQFNVLRFFCSKNPHLSSSTTIFFLCYFHSYNIY